jgi:Predicted transcriptional regulators
MNQKIISEKLILLRGKKTQKQVAAAIGIAQSTYAMYELGNRTPNDNIKIRIANYYKKSVQFIFFDNEVAKCKLEKEGEQ